MMTGCCSLAGLFWGMTFMASPFILAVLLFLLLARRPIGSPSREEL